MTIMNQYLLPLMNEVRDRVIESRIFIKIDLMEGYNLIWIKSCNNKKVAFCTRYKHYKYLVMPFRLMNISATFEHIINKILQDLIDYGLAIYIDNIIIYTENIEESIWITCEILCQL